MPSASSSTSWNAAPTTRRTRGCRASSARWAASCSQPDIAAKLEEDAQAQRDLMLPWVEKAQRSGEIRTDLTPARITSWLYLLTDGFLGRMADEEDFTPHTEKPDLIETARRFLAP